MALVFDSLGYTRKLRAGGIAQEQAEAMAEAARDYIMLELCTTQELQRETAALRDEIQREAAALLDEIQREAGAIREDLRRETSAIRKEMYEQFEVQTLRLTVRLGLMLAGGLALLATFMKLV